jgi:hypothetical protein
MKIYIHMEESLKQISTRIMGFDNMILIILFCNVNTSLLSDELHQKITAHFIKE